MLVMRQMPSARSRGAALILFVLLLVSLGAGVLIEAIVGSSPAPVSRDDRTSRSLAEAKEALLAWAVSHPTNKPDYAPGQLPFPDRGSDGFDGTADCVGGASLPVDANELLGRFPWRGDIDGGSQCLNAISTWPMTRQLFDNAGQPLWYAVSDKLVFNGNAPAPAIKINPGMLDQDTGGAWLSIRDATGAVLTDASGAALQIAAVIIGPGKAIGSQDRGSVAISNAAYPAQFLDSVTISGTTYSNSDLSGTFIMYPDSSTTASTTDAFNDRLVYITAQELLRATEQRVLGEVAVALSAYRQANERVNGTGDGGYPWLSPFLDPLGGGAALFDGVPGTRVGHLAYTDPSIIETTSDPLVTPITESYQLDTGFGVAWTSGGATPATEPSDPDNYSIPISPSPSTRIVAATSVTTMQAKVTDAAVDAETGSGIGSKTIEMPTATTGGDPSCAWRGIDNVVDCFATITESAGYDVTLEDDDGTNPPVLVGTFPVTRIYTFDLAFQGTSTLSSNSGARARDVDSGLAHASYPNAAAVSTIMVKDYVTAHPALSTTRRLTIGNGDPATIDVSGIYLEPTVGGGEAGDLPDWFHDNDWQRYVLVKYAANVLPAETWVIPEPSPTASPCQSGTNCVLVDVEATDGVRDDVRAVVIGAGWQFPATQDRVTGPPTIVDYFESENANVGLSTQRSVWNTATPFNDQIRIVEPGPLP